MTRIYDKFNKCAKCGSTACTTRYVPELESIARKCLVCTYQWTEIPQDQKKETVTECLLNLSGLRNSRSGR